ncbi:MAG: S8 family serine peptidase [Bdellovibrionia bacterium]
MSLTRIVCAGAFLLLGASLPARADSVAVDGEYIIKYKTGKGSVRAVNSKIAGKAVLKSSFSRMGLYHIKAQEGVPSRVIESLKEDPEVEYLEPNYILRKASSTGEPVKAFSDAQVASVSSAATTYVQSNAPIEMVESWDISSPLAQAGKIIVAVVDTGTDISHPYFANTNVGALWVNPDEVPGNGIDDDQNGYVDDIYGWNFVRNNAAVSDDEGHGTHVAGIVAGAGGNIIQSNPDPSKIQIMTLKFLDSAGAGSTANAIKAINYAVANGAKVINNSWGGPNYSRALHDAMTYAYNSNIVVVSAAGNYRSNNDATPIYPANYDVPSNISVAATDDYDSLASFSNYGATTVTIAAPGFEIVSTYPPAKYNSNYMYMSGTSMASPLVAGIAAMMRRENPSLSAYQVKQLLINSADNVSGLSNRVAGSGRVNAFNALQLSKVSINNANLSMQPSYSPSYLSSRSVASESSGSGEAGGGCGTVSSLGASGGPAGPSPGLVLVLMIPAFVWGFYRMTDKEGKSRRKFDRFKMDSKVVVKCGDRELIGQLNTISQGGISFNADTALEKGGIVTMRIQSPDGNEMIEVQGAIVWSEKDRSYGVAFQEARRGALAMIQDWTKGLARQN